MELNKTVKVASQEPLIYNPDNKGYYNPANVIAIEPMYHVRTKTPVVTEDGKQNRPEGGVGIKEYDEESQEIIGYFVAITFVTTGSVKISCVDEEDMLLTAHHYADRTLGAQS